MHDHSHLILCCINRPPNSDITHLESLCSNMEKVIGITGDVTCGLRKQCCSVLLLTCSLLYDIFRLYKYLLSLLISLHMVTTYLRSVLIDQL